MAYFIDIILIAGFVLTIIFAAKKGFAKIFLNIGASVLSFIAAYTLSRPAAEFIYEKIIREMIENSLAEKLEELPAGDALTQARALVESIPQGLVSLGEKIGLNVETLIASLNSANISAQNISATVTESVIKPIVIVLATAVCGLLVFIIASVVFGFLAKLLNKVFKLPFIKSVNKVLGGVLGVVQGAILLVLVCTIVYFLGGIIDGKLAEYIDNSVIIEAVNSINPILAKFKS